MVSGAVPGGARVGAEHELPCHPHPFLGDLAPGAFGLLRLFCAELTGEFGADSRHVPEVLEVPASSAATVVSAAVIVASAARGRGCTAAE
jgi:hypothetical protein